MTGSPISDMVPVLLAAGVKLNLCSLERGPRSVKLDHTFFTGYRRNIVAQDEILVSIEVPFTLPVRLVLSKQIILLKRSIDKFFHQF